MSVSEVSFRQDVSSEQMPHVPGPVPLAIENYYDRDTKSLFNSELKLHRSFVETANSLSSLVFRNLFITDESLERLRSFGDDPAVIAPNHRDYMDLPALGLALSEAGLRPARYIAKAELFKKWPLAWLFGHLGAIPVDRNNINRPGACDRDVLGKRVEYTLRKERNKLVIFPEGTRQKSRQLGPIEKGAALFAARNKVPIIPVGLAGTEGAYRRLLKGERPRVAVVVGEPYMPSRRLKQEEVVLTERIQSAIDEAYSLLDTYYA